MSVSSSKVPSQLPFLMLLGLLYNSPIWGLCLLESDLGRCTCFWNGQLLKRYWTVESCVKGETTALERGPPPTSYLLWAATELREEPQCELVLFGAFNHFSSWPHVSTVISWGDTLFPLALPFMKIRVLVMTTIVIMSAEPQGQQVWPSTLMGMCTRVWASTLRGMCTRVNQRKGTWACNRKNRAQDDGPSRKSGLYWSEFGLCSLGLCLQALKCVDFVIVYCGLLVLGLNACCWLETYLRKFPFHLRNRVPSGEPIKDSLQH